MANLFRQHLAVVHQSQLDGTMGVGRLVIFLAFVATVCCSPRSRYNNKCVAKTFELVTRDEWGAQSPVIVSQIGYPVPYVVIHHTYLPGACFTREDCMRAMRSMQNYHQLTQGWTDIGYSFGIGGDGAAYVGRGWDVVGAHTVGYNSRSIGIAFIGSFITELPLDSQMDTLKQLIATGVELGYIDPDYKIIGHRQAADTECPGEALFQEIQTWDRFDTEI